MFEKLEKNWSKIEDLVVGSSAGLALVIICYDVVTRYFVPSISTDWGSDLVVYFTVWALMIASSQLVRDGRHVQADLIVRLLSDRVQVVLAVMNMAVGFFYTGAVMYFGIRVVQFAIMLDERSENSLLIPLYLYYLAIPIGFGLMAVRFLIRIKQFTIDGVIIQKSAFEDSQN